MSRRRISCVVQLFYSQIRRVLHLCANNLDRKCIHLKKYVFKEILEVIFIIIKKVDLLLYFKDKKLCIINVLFARNLKNVK
jgi:hypothetical protein